MKKYYKRLLITSVASLALSIVAIVLLIKSHFHSLRLIRNSEYIVEYTADINEYHTYVILLYLLLLFGAISSIITYCIGKTFWISSIINAVCILTTVLITSLPITNTPIPFIWIIFILGSLMCHYSVKLGQNNKNLNTQEVLV